MAQYTEIADMIQLNGDYSTMIRFADGRVSGDAVPQVTISRILFEEQEATDPDRFERLVMNANPSLSTGSIDEINHSFELKHDVLGLKVDLTLGDLVIEYLWDKTADTITTTRAAAFNIQWRSWLLWVKCRAHFVKAITEYRDS